MSYNRKLLKQMTEESKQKKPQPKPKDRIVDPMGQWAHPGKVTRIPSNRITMQGVPYPVLGVGNNGQQQMMYPGQEYSFPGSTYVDEYPLMQARNGGEPTPLELAKIKAKMALESHFGNPSARRMTTLYPQDLAFKLDRGKDKGKMGYGTHWMGDMGNYAVPFIQEDASGKLFFKKNASPRDREAIRFNTPEEALMFAENYKEVAPMSREKYLGGGDISIPNLEEGNWLDRYDEGGLTTAETTLPPIYIDRNDAKAMEKYNMWKDSSYAHETYTVPILKSKDPYFRKILTANLDFSNDYQLGNAKKNPKAYKKLLSHLKNNKNDLGTRKLNPNILPKNYVAMDGAMAADFKKPVQPYIIKTPNSRLVTKLTRETNFVRKPIEQERPQIKMVGQDRVQSITPSFNFAPTRISTIDRPKGNYAVDYFDENLQPQTNYFPTPEIADMFMKERMENKMYGPSMTRRGVYQDGGPIPAYARGPMKGDIQMRGNVNIPTQMAYDASKARKAQAAREKTTIGADTRTAAQKAKDRQAYESKVKYEKEVLGKDYETPQYLQEKNRARAEHLLHLADVGTMGAGLATGALKAAPRVGEYLTTQTPLKNAYKYNPWAFKPNPKAAYRMIGEEGYADALESGIIRAKPSAGKLNIQTGKIEYSSPNYEHPYFSYGKPWDKNLVKGKPWMGYKGPYMVELTNERSLIENELAYSTGKNNIYRPTRIIESNEPNVKFYKEDWLRGYKEVPKPTSMYEDYFKNTQANDKRLQNLLSSKKITYDDYLEQQKLYKEELQKKLGLGKKLGSGSYGEVFEVANNPSKVVKLGRPYGDKWTPELIESLKSIKQNANVAIPEQVQIFDIPSQWKGYGSTKQEVMTMPNLNKIFSEKLNLNKRDRYAYFLKQARQLRDKGILLDVKNPENFKFNELKNVFDIYDINPGHSADPAAYMRYVKNNTQKRLLDDMMYKKGGETNWLNKYQ